MPTENQPNGSWLPRDGTTPNRPAATDRLESFARRVVVAVLVTLLFVVLTAVLWRGLHVLLQAFAGVLFALFLTALSDWLSRRTGIAYGRALTVVVIGLLVLTGGVGWLLANRLAAQVGELAQTLPQSLTQVRDYLAESTWGRLLLKQLPQTSDALNQAGQLFVVTGPGLFEGMTAFLEAALVIMIVGIFGAAETDLYRQGLLHVVPPQHRRRASEVLDAIVYNLRWWLVGQVVLMIVLWVTTTVALWLLGIPLAMTLGLITGMMELIPYLGAWIAAVPTALVALLVGPWHVLMVLGLYLGLHLLEGYVLFPLIQRRAVHLPPALTLVMQVLFGELMGVMGLIVAAPLTVVLVVACQMLYVEDTLGDQTVEVPGEPATAGAADGKVKAG